MKKLFTIDIHTHILPKDIPNFNKQFGYGEFVQLEHHKPCCAKMMMNDQFFREVESNCWEAVQFCVENSVDVMSFSLGWLHDWGPDRSTWRNTMNNALWNTCCTG